MSATPTAGVSRNLRSTTSRVGKRKDKNQYISTYAQPAKQKTTSDISNVNISSDSDSNVPVTIQQLNMALDKRLDRFSSLFKESLNEIKKQL